MKLCSNCAHENREGYLYCEECGQTLTSDETSGTKTLEAAGNGEFAAHATWGTARFEKDAAIILHIRDASEPITFQPDSQTILGRSDSTSTQKPDLDLSPYGALEKGVSRIHTAIFRNEDTLTVIDKGSANGTYLNGQRLIPNQPRVLRDGDEIRLGKLIAHIYFKPTR
ncbi:MAG: FHA domain-containing protein [Chloroflexota bacterium]